MAWENFDFEKLNGEAEEIRKNNGNGEYKEVPHSNYEVCIDKLEIGESKNGDPMLTIWFKILAGEFKNSRLFYNQLLTTGMGIHSANQMLRSFDTGVEIEWKNKKELENIIRDIKFATDPKNVSFNLKYDSYTSKKGVEFNTFKIEEIYDVE